jgi:heat shock protein HslJ
MIGYDYGCKMNMRTKLKSFILTAILFGSFYGLRAQVATDSLSKDKTTKVTKLLGKWYLVPVLPSDTATGHLPELDFDISQSLVSGSTGCNRITGSILVTDTSLHFSDKMASTRMACIGYDETTFLKNLLRIDGYEFKNELLILTTGGVEMSRWSRKPMKPKKTETT